MTGQQSQHHAQGFRAALIVLADTLQILGWRSSPHGQIELSQRPKDFDKFRRLALIVPKSRDPEILAGPKNRRSVLGKNQPQPIAIYPFAIREMTDHFVGGPFSLKWPPAQ